MSLSSLLVDSHCHLDRLDLQAHDGKLSNALRFAAANGVGHFLCVNIDLEHFDDVLAPAEQYENIYASVGVHPTEQQGEEPTLQRLTALAAHEKIIAIGETGLDYFHCKDDTEWQRERFRVHIRAAQHSGKPLIIHMRDATEDTLRIMQEEKADEIGGVMHCFVEDRETAQRCLDLNFYISFSGIVTFNSARQLKEVAQKMPLDKMLVETDSPYLAPVPYRGKTNQPAYVRHVAEHIAELRGVSVETIAAATTENFFRLFKLK